MTNSCLSFSQNRYRHQTLQAKQNSGTKTNHLFRSFLPTNIHHCFFTHVCLHFGIKALPSLYWRERLSCPPVNQAKAKGQPSKEPALWVVGIFPEPGSFWSSFWSKLNKSTSYCETNPCKYAATTPTTETHAEGSALRYSPKQAHYSPFCSLFSSVKSSASSSRF